MSTYEHWVPPFPGPSWIYLPAPPVTLPEGWARVQARAKALLPILWRHGNGASVVEKTGGERGIWIAYRAELTGPQRRKGVVAYRIKPGEYQGPDIIRGDG